MKSQVKIAVVEDDLLTAADIQSKLQKLGFQVVALAKSSAEAILLIKKTEPDLVIMDVELQGQTDGIETARYISDQYEIPVIFLSAHSDESILKRARSSRPYAFIVKPLDIQTLESSIELALYRNMIEHENRALVNLKNAAEKANYSKSIFLANMSHELRTPLNSILGFAKLMKMGYEPEEYDDQLARIIGGGENLLTMVNDILDYMKVHAGKAKYFMKRINPLPEIEACLNNIEHCAAEKGLSIVSVLPDEPITIFVDPKRFRQIITNLLSNALKYSATGETIDVRLYVKERHCIVEIQDSGPGIAKIDQKIILETFEQINSNGSCESMGSELGLAITRILVEAHGGLLELESDLGEGTLFRVVFAALDGLSEEIPTLTDESVGYEAVDGKILIVEDNRGNRDFMIKYFEKFNQKIIAVSDGYECLDLYDRGEVDDIAVILMDLRMKGLSGTDTIHELKLREVTTPVIAVSAFIQEDIQKESIKDEFAGFVTKPVDFSELNRVIKTAVLKT